MATIALAADGLRNLAVASNRTARSVNPSPALRSYCNYDDIAISDRCFCGSSSSLTLPAAAANRLCVTPARGSRIHEKGSRLLPWYDCTRGRANAETTGSTTSVKFAVGLAVRMNRRSNTYWRMGGLATQRHRGASTNTGGAH